MADDGNYFHLNLVLNVIRYLKHGGDATQKNEKNQSQINFKFAVAFGLFGIFSFFPACGFFSVFCGAFFGFFGFFGLNFEFRQEIPTIQKSCQQ